MAKTISASEASLHQGIGVNKSSGDSLDDLEDLHRIGDSTDFSLTDFEDGEGDAEEGLTALIEERVPDS